MSRTPKHQECSNALTSSPWKNPRGYACPSVLRGRRGASNQCPLPQSARDTALQFRRVRASCPLALLSNASIGLLPGVASIGPRPEGRGDVRLGVSERDVVHASIGPRPECRGDGGLADPQRPIVCASIGPRPEGRGDTQDRRQDDHGVGGFNWATARRPWRRADAPPPPHPPESRFNWATARRPWRRPDVRTRDSSSRGASIGPRPEGRGDKTGLVLWLVDR